MREQGTLNCLGWGGRFPGHTEGNFGESMDSIRAHLPPVIGGELLEPPEERDNPA